MGRYFRKFKRILKKNTKRLKKTPVRRGVSRPKAKNMLRVIPQVMSKCAIDYLKAQYNPWAEFDEPPCVPDLIAIPSRKQAYTIRGEFAVGTSGTGFVVLNPYQLWGSASGFVATNGNFPAPVMFTTADYASVSVNDYTNRLIDTAPEAGIAFAYWNSEFDAGPIMDSNIQDGVFQYRIVGAGIKVKYAGQPLYRQGNYILYEDAENNGNLYAQTGGYSQARFLQDTSASTWTAVDDREHAVVWHPRNMDDLQFITSNEISPTDPGSVIQSLRAYDVLCIAVFGGTNSTETSNPGYVSFECVVHTEQIGSVVPNKTRTHSDLDGFSKVSNQFETKPSTASPKFVAYEKLKNIGKEAVKVGANAIFGNSAFVNSAASAVAEGGAMLMG